MDNYNKEGAMPKKDLEEIWWIMTSSNSAYYEKCVDMKNMKLNWDCRRKVQERLYNKTILEWVEKMRGDAKK